MYEQQEMTVEQIGQVLGVSRTTIYRTFGRDQVTPRKGRKPKGKPSTGKAAGLIPEEPASSPIEAPLGARP